MGTGLRSATLVDEDGARVADAREQRLVDDVDGRGQVRCRDRGKGSIGAASLRLHRGTLLVNNVWRESGASKTRNGALSAKDDKGLFDGNPVDLRLWA
jgi:hypothetical protein